LEVEVLEPPEELPELLKEPLEELAELLLPETLPPVVGVPPLLLSAVASYG
jgi:hypothetical protein